ncbi:unnamed protein product [Paramecium sonneborni]|uniref:Uncharacterized protein n=1 Tax=Paramecium sonneborni TaxID=65129 RepID=A0A8S1RF17_9CILI|nr:unnamed protein product [Paramecium sonneborni]
MFFLTQIHLGFFKNITWSKNQFEFPQFIQLIVNKTVFQQLLKDQDGSDFLKYVGIYQLDMLVTKQNLCITRIFITLVGEMEQDDIDYLKQNKFNKELIYSMQKLIEIQFYCKKMELYIIIYLIILAKNLKFMQGINYQLYKMKIKMKINKYQQKNFIIILVINNLQNLQQQMVIQNNINFLKVKIQILISKVLLDKIFFNK